MPHLPARTGPVLTVRWPRADPGLAYAWADTIPHHVLENVFSFLAAEDFGQSSFLCPTHARTHARTHTHTHSPTPLSAHTITCRGCLACGRARPAKGGSCKTKGGSQPHHRLAWLTLFAANAWRAGRARCVCTRWRNLGTTSELLKKRFYGDIHTLMQANGSVTTGGRACVRGFGVCVCVCVGGGVATCLLAQLVRARDSSFLCSHPFSPRSCPSFTLNRPAPPSRCQRRSLSDCCRRATSAQRRCCRAPHRGMCTRAFPCARHLCQSTPLLHGYLG